MFLAVENGEFLMEVDMFTYILLTLAMYSSQCSLAIKPVNAFSSLANNPFTFPRGLSCENSENVRFYNHPKPQK